MNSGKSARNIRKRGGKCNSKDTSSSSMYGSFSRSSTGSLRYSYARIAKKPSCRWLYAWVSSGASLGAVFAIALGLHIPMIGSIGVTVMSILFAFLSIILILTLAHILDYSLSTNTIILVGVIFSMFAGSVTNLLVTFAGDKVKNIMFWTMGSFTGTTFQDAGIVLLGFNFLQHSFTQSFCRVKCICYGRGKCHSYRS